MSAKKPRPPKRAGLIVCSCRTRLEPDEVEAHAVQHGLEGDTYVAAQLRAWVKEIS